MRSFMVGSVVAAALMTLAATGSADEKVRPHIEVAPSVRIVGFHRAAGQTGAYTGGALSLVIEVENTGDKPADGITVKLASASGVVETSLFVPAHAKRTATLQDAEGLASSCSPKAYTISLGGLATRSARITPSCTFSSTLEETWNQMTPDHVEAEKSGNVYLTSPSIVSAPACGKAAPSIKARIVSHAAMSSPSIIVQAKEWSAAAPVKAQTLAAFPIAPNEQKDVLLTPLASAGTEPELAKMKLTIVDWTKSLGGHTSDGGIFVTTTRSCSLDVALLP